MSAETKATLAFVDTETSGLDVWAGHREVTDTYWPGDVSVGPLHEFLNPPGEPPDTDDGYTAEDEAAYWAAVDAAAAGGSS